MTGFEIQFLPGDGRALGATRQCLQVATGYFTGVLRLRPFGEVRFFVHW
jgi:hypothetical protein